jgi:hypothetical protein
MRLKKSNTNLISHIVTKGRSYTFNSLSAFFNMLQVIHHRPYFSIREFIA